MVNYFTPLPRVSPGQSLLVEKRFGQFDTALHEFRTGARAVAGQRFPSPTALTISAGGAIAITDSFHKVDTNGGAASDDLDTINGAVEGDVLFLQNANTARDVVLRHNAGNIFLRSQANFTLSGATKAIWLFRVGNWWVDARPKKSVFDTIYPWTALGADGQFDVSFAPIYKHLRLYFMLRSDNAASVDIELRLNDADASSDYSRFTHWFSNISSDSQTLVNTAQFSISAAAAINTSSYFTVGRLDIFGCDSGYGAARRFNGWGYTNNFDGNGGQRLFRGGGHWDVTDEAVDRIRVFHTSLTGDFEAGSALAIVGWR